MRICFVDRSTKLETINDLETKPRGGMVSSLFKISDYLSQRGHDVWVVSDLKERARTSHGTNWLWEFPGDLDFLIFNRGTGSAAGEVEAKHRILWTHDLPHAGFIPESKTIKAFSATVFMSEYAKRVWKNFNQDIGKSFIIPNGVDKSIFYPRQKDLGYLIYASAPNRGLKRLPFIFDCIKTRTKRPVRMRAYSNLSVLHPNETQDDLSDTYNAVAKSEVELHDPIPQKQLAEELGKAGLMILPTDYPEICSNIILQSLASGTPVITTGNLGSANEWVKHRRNGMLTQWMPHDYMVYQADMMRNAVEVLDNERLHRKLIRSSNKIYTWDQIGTQWNNMLERLI